MKKSSQFILIVLAVIITGVFWRISGYYLEEKRKKKEVQLKEWQKDSSKITNEQLQSNLSEQQKIQNSGLSQIDDTMSIATKQESRPNGEKRRKLLSRNEKDSTETIDERQNESENLEMSNDLAPVESWKKILIGRWYVDEREYGKRDLWITLSKVDFQKDNSFVLTTTAEYYDLTHPIKFGDKFEANVTAGGKVVGNWEIVDKTIQLFSDACKIMISDSSNSSNMSQKLKVRTCDFFHKRVFGTFSDAIYSLDIIQFNKTSIKIIGTNYITGAEVKYSLYKL